MQESLPRNNEVSLAESKPAFTWTARTQPRTSFYNDDVIYMINAQLTGGERVRFAETCFHVRRAIFTSVFENLWAPDVDADVPDTLRGVARKLTVSNQVHLDKLTYDGFETLTLDLTEWALRTAYARALGEVCARSREIAQLRHLFRILTKCTRLNARGLDYQPAVGVVLKEATTWLAALRVVPLAGFGRPLFSNFYAPPGNEGVVTLPSTLETIEVQYEPELVDDADVFHDLIHLCNYLSLAKWGSSTDQHQLSIHLYGISEQSILVRSNPSKPGGTGQKRPFFGFSATKRDDCPSRGREVRFRPGTIPDDGDPNTTRDSQKAYMVVRANQDPETNAWSLLDFWHNPSLRHSEVTDWYREYIGDDINERVLA